VLDFWRKESTEEVIESLRPRSGNEEALRAYPDGTIANGHHCIEILRERGVDVSQLPREIRIPETQ
jgi:hypothetical protein